MTAAWRLTWEELQPGQSVEQAIAFTQADHDAFAALSGDCSRVHADAAFAAANGFAGPVVYGGLIVARLSCIPGMHLPGDLSLSASWHIDFHNPLYIGESALFRARISHKSEAARLLSLKVEIRRGETLIARAQVQSRMLQEG